MPHPDRSPLPAHALPTAWPSSRTLFLLRYTYCVSPPRHAKAILLKGFPSQPAVAHARRHGRRMAAADAVELAGIRANGQRLRFTRVTWPRCASPPCRQISDGDPRRQGESSAGSGVSSQTRRFSAGDRHRYTLAIADGNRVGAVHAPDGARHPSPQWSINCTASPTEKRAPPA